jgi:hypothetical protein
MELDEPLEQYSGHFKEHHARITSEYFENLVKESKVDEEANKKTVALLRDLESSIKDVSSSRRKWRALRIIALILATGLSALAFSLGEWHYLWLAPAIGSLVFMFVKINPEVKNINTRIADLDLQKEEKLAIAWGEMANLNSLFRWETARELFQQTFPQVELDKYFSSGRLNDLRDNYGLSDQFNNGRSILHSQSGEILGNPFVITRFMSHWIGSFTYTGTLVIYWTEQTRNAQGQLVTIQRSQTLTASVNKPYPMYQNRSAIVYGHEAAPNLTFTRNPSNLSGLEEGALNDWRKARGVKKVERIARRDVKSGNGDFTVMSNKEFEALFKAVNRDNEIEFRLLFTPLAQQEMVKLMNDKTDSYGDDFSFEKYGSINIVEPAHLGETSFDGDPSVFASYELASARKFFNDFHNNYFRSIFFGFAPLLTVPLYREERSAAATSSHKPNSETSFWEHEVMANYIGQASFRHPESSTLNLLKASSSKSNDGVSKVTVMAYGYKGIGRVDYVSVLGGDGNLHQVPVPWTEYIPVEKETKMMVTSLDTVDSDSSKNTSDWESVLAAKGIDIEAATIRGALAAALL